MRGFTKHRAELCAVLEREAPHFVALNEKKLDKSARVIDLSAYVLVSRRDRPDESALGSIAFFAK